MFPSLAHLNKVEDNRSSGPFSFRNRDINHGEIAQTRPTVFLVGEAS
jgi:hypothetical protein